MADLKITKNYGKTNRTKGFNAEREYAKAFRNLGFPHCKTTRASSRLLDSCKVDLDFIPYCIQIKAGKQKSLNYSKTLLEMNSMLVENYPQSHEIHKYPKLIIHHKQGTSGMKRTENDVLVIMSFDTFKQIIWK